jgi:hypothetical protein
LPHLLAEAFIYSQLNFGCRNELFDLLCGFFLNYNDLGELSSFKDGIDVILLHVLFLANLLEKTHKVAFHSGCSFGVSLHLGLDFYEIFLRDRSVEA